jgi:hypothetical protein
MTVFTAPFRGTPNALLEVTVLGLAVLLDVTYGYCMNTSTSGERVAHTQYDPEDVRIGETLQALMYRNEETPEGFIIRRKIKHDELAQNIVVKGRRGVSRSYISQLCTGAKHMNNDMLYAIARYLNINPVAIKRPDLDRELMAA